METKKISTLKINTLVSQEQYDKAYDENKIEQDSIYLVPDDTEEIAQQKADEALENAKEYTDTVISSKANVTDLTSHTEDTTIHITEEDKNNWNAKSEFSGDYNDLDNKPIIPSIDGLATETFVNNTVSTKADSEHNHDDVYYTETEVDEKIATEVTNRNSAIDSAKSSAISTASSDTTTKITAHNTAIDAHNDIRVLISDLTTQLNNFLDVDDNKKDQLSEVLALIENNRGTLESLTTNKINVADIIDNLITASKDKVLSANQGVVIKGLIDALQTSVNGKADSSHGHEISDVNGLQSALDSKAVKSDLTSHSGNTTIHITATERTNWNAAKTHADSTHAPTNAEKNQNAFSNVKAGSTTISADTTTDTIEFVAGSNITLTPDATNDKLTITAKDTVYTHPTTTGNKHIPSGGSSGQILRWSSDGTAVWGNDNNTTYNPVTQSANGLMSAADKKKLDGIATGANAYSHPAYTARTGVPTANATPAFGGTFSVTQPISDATGHITGMNSRTITIPSTVASQSVNGLMTAADKKKLDGIPSDTQAQLNSRARADLLWTSASGAGHFPAQTLTIPNMDYYTLIMIVFYWDSSGQSLVAQYVINNIKNFALFTTSSGANQLINLVRDIVADGNQLTFSDIYYNGVSTTSKNGYLAPYQIIGVHRH